MKKVKMIFSVALFSAVAFGAFAFSSKSEAVANVPGYIKHGFTCEEVTRCSNIPSSVLCTDITGAQAFDMSGVNQCAADLWKL
ncbi:MAG: hypothetical protein M0D53_00635 [Flavobacterium sp. JAD_PAG50586_2]|nr:MAG: hypothetical protein M0D53_00635 [Flavobacterium sp. JAD_PAG50586_2]